MCMPHANSLNQADERTVLLGLESVSQHLFNKSAVWSSSVLSEWGSVALEESMWGQTKVIDIIEPNGAIERPSDLHL